MRGQLDRLQTVVGVPNIRFGILPLGVQLATTPPKNSFQMDDDLVETFVGETTHRDDEAAAYAKAIERLWTKPSPAMTLAGWLSKRPRTSGPRRRTRGTSRSSLAPAAVRTCQ
jgi:hypothetical protein